MTSRRLHCIAALTAVLFTVAPLAASVVTAADAAADTTRRAILSLHLPPGYSFGFSGPVRILDETTVNMILAVLLAYYRMPPGWPVIALPLLLGIQSLLTLALALPLAERVSCS